MRPLGICMCEVRLKKNVYLLNDSVLKMQILKTQMYLIVH